MVKKNYKIIIGIIIGVIVSSIGVYAASLSSSEVTYNNKETGIKAENLQGAIDELYDKTNFCDNSNVNIVKAYAYNQSVSKETNGYCITGDESTCQLSDCYKTKNADSCPPGTIIDYLVSNREMIRFHVIKDNGNTITLQSQKNTIYNTVWSTEADNTKGPLTILAALEDKTNNWNNVNVLEYSIGDGSTTLGYAGCNNILYCNEKTYELSKSNVKARMITIQETNTLGCKNAQKSCPIWVYNYLRDSTSYDGTINDTYTENNGIENNGYWTMNAYAEHPLATRMVNYKGTANDYTDLNAKYFGARAVVEINKSSG